LASTKTGGREKLGKGSKSVMIRNSITPTPEGPQLKGAVPLRTQQKKKS